jgi:ferredoxin
MTYLVTEACIQCKYTDCVSVCPVDCFHEGPNFLAINPDECIDCGVCVSECPVDAIIADNDVTHDVPFWFKLNKELSQQWPVIARKKDALPDAEQFKNVVGKIDLLKK